MNKKLIIMRGVPGSGKSYIVSQMGDCVVCSADHYFMVNGEYKFDPTLIGQAHNACLRKCIDSMNARKPLIVVDNTAVHVWEFENYINLARKYNYKVEIYEAVVETVDAIRTCIKRNTHGVPAGFIARAAVEFEPAATAYKESDDLRIIKFPV